MSADNETERAIHGPQPGGASGGGTGGGGRTDMPPSYPPANPPSYQQATREGDEEPGDLINLGGFGGALGITPKQGEAGPLPMKDVNLLENDIFDPLAEENQKPDPPPPPPPPPTTQVSRSPRHAYSHPDYEERPDGAESRQQRSDETAEQWSGGGGQTSIVPTQKMLQDKYEQ